MRIKSVRWTDRRLDIVDRSRLTRLPGEEKTRNDEFLLPFILLVYSFDIERNLVKVNEV
jgi:hypothetical protein